MSRRNQDELDREDGLLKEPKVKKKRAKVQGATKRVVKPKVAKPLTF